MKSYIEHVLGNVIAAGYDSLFTYMNELLNIHDQQLSAQVSQMLGHHGKQILNSICVYQPCKCILVEYKVYLDYKIIEI